MRTHTLDHFGVLLQHSWISRAQRRIASPVVFLRDRHTTGAQRPTRKEATPWEPTTRPLAAIGEAGSAYGLGVDDGRDRNGAGRTCRPSQHDDNPVTGNAGRRWRRGAPLDLQRVPGGNSGATRDGVASGNQILIPIGLLLES